MSTGTVIEPIITMRKRRLKTVTLLLGILIAISVISLGIGFSQSSSISQISAGGEIPSLNLVDMNKVFYIFFSK